MNRKALSAAFPVTVPVLMGYLAIGMAFGFMLQAIGYNFIWAFFMSLTIYAGSGQYLGVALLSSAQAPVGVDPRSFYFAIALLDQSYWIIGSVIGAVAGALIPVDTTGIDFAMTALFVVIAVDQWKAYRNHLPALLGFGVTIVFLIILGQIFGQQQMLIVSLGVIVLLLLILRDKLEEKEGKEAC